MSPLGPMGWHDDTREAAVSDEAEQSPSIVEGPKRCLWQYRSAQRPPKGDEVGSRDCVPRRGLGELPRLALGSFLPIKEPDY
jgi:hypothetical protein